MVLAEQSDAGELLDPVRGFCERMPRSGLQYRSHLTEEIFQQRVLAISLS
jgi:hypothetical protein